MRSFGTLLIVVWLLIGGFAAYQRGYPPLADTQASCTNLSTVALTIVAGPLNYLGINPKIECTMPQPSP